jgi:hypothetical protein
LNSALALSPAAHDALKDAQPELIELIESWHGLDETARASVLSVVRAMKRLNPPMSQK